MSRGLTKQIKDTINLLKDTDINGCITGSCLLDENFDEWESVPDIDVFVYSIESQIHAVDVLEYKYGFKPGKYDHNCDKGEAWKVQRLRTYGMRKDSPLSTVSMYKDGITVNVSYRKDQRKLVDVISVFDMTIIMRGIDIPTGYELNLTGDDSHTARLNPLRTIDYSIWNTKKWVRQFDRVIKYWNRGFDTRPVAQAYIDMINTVIETGSLFTSEKAEQSYKEFAEEYIEVRDHIQMWLDDKEDC